MTGFAVRYIVTDVEAAVAFYRDALGFTVKRNAAPGFAMLVNGALTLFVNAPGAGGAGRETGGGPRPEPGGWNRFQVQVDDLSAEIERLRGLGAGFRGEVIEGRGGRQILLLDPSGNPVEIFEAFPDRK